VQLERVVRNLVDNAARYARGHVEVRVATDATDTAVLLTVEDDGPGIPPADRERVFERFTRLEDDRSRDTGGTGLGLAIAREIAERHHGTLHAEQAGSGGARFVLRVPAA
jgi:signal transduction histidine kinase